MDISLTQQAKNVILLFIYLPNSTNLVRPECVRMKNVSAKNHAESASFAKKVENSYSQLLRGDSRVSHCNCPFMCF